MAIRAHYDGKTIVPDEPVDAPVNQPLEIELRVIEDRLSDEEIKRRRAAIRRFVSKAIPGLIVSDYAFSRDSIYWPPRGL